MQGKPMDSNEALLAVINREMQVISERLHQLARRKAILQEQATRLRLGASAASARQAIKEMSPPAGLSRWSMPPSPGSDARETRREQPRSR
jgi:hypothetical protein